MRGTTKIRPFKESDAADIDRIWNEHWSSEFSVPDRKNMIVDSVVVDEHDKVIAYGQVRMFPEAMFICDKSRGKKLVVQALILLMHQAFDGINRAGLNRMYCFIKDPDFAMLIQKHFLFHPVTEPGQLLLWEE